MRKLYSERAPGRMRPNPSIENWRASQGSQLIGQWKISIVALKRQLTAHLPSEQADAPHIVCVLTHVASVFAGISTVAGE
ncbi:hypothetical protein K525DRAFT_262041, partial [Schizophyllum commune Loenen D]